MQLKDYIQGNRKGKEANRLERDAMNDPFLQDALEGFDAVTGDHAQIISRLENKINNPAAEITQNDDLSIDARKPRQNRKGYYYWSVAASILLIIGFGFFFLWDSNEQMPTIVMIQSPEKEAIQVEEMVSMPEEPETPVPHSPAPALSEQVTRELPDMASRASAVKQSAQVSKAIAQKEMRVVEAKEEEAVATNIEVEAIDFSSEDDASLTTTFTAKVTDEAGIPLPGVSISRKGAFGGTATNAEGVFSITVPENDSSKLIASYLGYTPKEIDFSDKNQVITLREDPQALQEVVVVAFGTQKKEAVVGSAAIADRQTPFGAKDFQEYCRQKADKNVCDGKRVSVRVSFELDEFGKPKNIKSARYTCEAAKNEVEKLLLSSPAWTVTNKKVTMTVKW